MSSQKKRNFQIEAFKHRVVVDPKYAEKTWKVLEHAIHEIYNHNASGLSFEELYRNAYNMVLHKFGEKLYSGLVSTMTLHLKEIAASVEASQGPLFLEELNRKWLERNKALQMIRDILMYMDRTFIPSTHKTPVHELGLNLWRDNIIRSVNIKTRLKDTLLETVLKERGGEVIDRGLMRNIMKMLMDLGPFVYQQEFEKSFLDVSADFYRGESQEFIECCDCGDYLKKAEKRLNEEIERVTQNAYNMVLHKFGEKLYSGLVSTMTLHLKEIAASVEASQGPLFLEELNRKWLERNKALQMIRDILMYMDRTFIPSTHKTPVHELGLNLWRDNIIRSVNIKTRLKDTLLETVLKERGGEVIDRGLMRNIMKMLMDLGPFVYQQEFEKSFLDVSADFYRGESQEFIECCDCGDYLKKAEKRLNEEIERVTQYLDAKSEPKITNVVEKEMIESQMTRLVHMENSGLVNMVVDDKYGDLHRMYNLFKRVPNGLMLIREVLTSHIRETGKQLVTDPERLKDPVDFVQRLLDEKDKHDKTINLAFNNDKLFQNALNSSFEYFINLNTRSPEFISLFVDDKLRKGLKGVTEEDAEVVLDKVMMLFRYLQEKDVFEKYYKQHLAKRLLSGKSVSEDAERSLILKLKTECGYQFTSKLEGMFTDMKTSQDTMQAFYEAMGPALADGPTLSVHVLTTGSWPTQSSTTCNLPLEILSVCDKFRTYYLGTHNGRRLTWQTNMGSADIKATFSRGQKHELNVSTYQMCVLMLYNNADQLSYREIEQAVEIPTMELKRCLQSLACAKGKNVLRKEPMSKDINEDDVFFFNEKFSSKFYKVKIGMVVAQKESEPEKQETRHKVEEDRKPQIEAAIVRIMKARRVLDHNNVVAEVTKQLQSRFLPNPVVIKKRIESLIEREFLERDKEDRKLYRYLA